VRQKLFRAWNSIVADSIIDLAVKLNSTRVRNIVMDGKIRAVREYLPGNVACSDGVHAKAMANTGSVAAMPTIVAMNPFRCRMWEFHDRLEAHISERTCRDEIESVSRHGQVVPALGRVLRDEPGYDAELICGARRLFVAKLLNQPLTVELRTLSDREALIAMDAENRLRSSISPYERALSYSQWLRSGHFDSQNDIARALNISASQVSRVLKLAQLPAIVVQAFDNPTEIMEDWGLTLLARLKDPWRTAGSIGGRSVHRRPNAAAASARRVSALACRRA
jgi:ParB/RepB/Spo0J family partition protein